MSINKFTTKEVLNKVLLDSSGNAVNAFSHTTQEAFNAALDNDNSRLNVNLVGGTIGGDVTINGDLTVNGDGAGNYDEIVNGELHVKITDTNAFLVEKADGTDVFTVDTTNSRVGINVPPTVPLHVYHATSNGVALFESGDASGGIALKDNSTSNNVFLLATGDNFGIQTGGVANRLVVDSSGDVTFGNTAIFANNKSINFLNTSGAEKAIITFDSSNITKIGDTSSSGTLQLNAGNATFAGNVTVNGVLKQFRDDSSTVGTNDVIIENDGSGDASLKFSLTGATDWFAYVDNSDSDKFKIRRSTTDHLSIDESGKVGIGTASPQSSLEIELGGDTGTYFEAGGNGNDASDLRHLLMTASTTTNAGDTHAINAESSTGVLKLQTSGTDRMVIDANSRISLSNNDSGTSNTVFGKLAGNALDSGGNYNVILGDNAGNDLTTGDENVLIGYLAGDNITTQTGNIFIGKNTGGAGQQLSILIGNDTGRLISSGNGTIGVGHNTLYMLQTGQYNTVVGYDSMRAEVDGDRSTAFGYQTLRSQTGTDGTVGTTAIGYKAGYNATSGIHGIFIGADANPSSGSSNNEIVIGYGVTGVGSNSVTLGNADATDVYMASDQRAKMHSGQIETIMDSSTNANIAVIRSENNSNYSASILHVTGDRTTTDSTYNLANFTNAGTSKFVIRDSGNAVNTNNSYGAISDEKLKQDIADASSQWDDIKAVKFRKFKFKNNVEEGFKLGVVAQELEKTSPNLVDESIDRDVDGKDLGTTTKSVKYSILQMKGIVALQEALNRIETLEAKVKELESK